jgi:glycosyltransferase involved in cell wall biosynthesis
MDVTFVEPKAPLRANANLQDGLLPAETVSAVPLDRRRPISFLRALHALWRADLAYLFFPGTVPRAIARLCRLLRKPYALYLRGERFDSSGKDASVLRGAHFVCCVGGLSDKVQALNRRTVEVRPMLDLSPQDARRRQGRAPGPWRLLFVGRLEEAKGIPELVEAAQQLHQRGFPLQLTLVGGGPLHERLVSQHGAATPGPLRILGVIDNKTMLHAEYELADLFVLPTHHEGFPRVLVEAMLKSLVLLTTFVGGIPHVLKAGMDCIELPMRDAAGIADAIVKITGDAQAMQRLSENALLTGLRLLERPTHVEAMLAFMHPAFDAENRAR